jgi:hypothetical protein
MAYMVIPNEGKILWLGWALITDGSDFEPFDVKLFQNQYTPTDTSTASDFTEATFPGYAQVQLTRGNFNDVTVANNVATSVNSIVPTYTCTGGQGQTVYGWYMIGDTSGKCLAAQVFDTPRNMTNGTSELLNPFQLSLIAIPQPQQLQAAKAPASAEQPSAKA